MSVAWCLWSACTLAEVEAEVESHVGTAHEGSVAVMRRVRLASQGMAVAMEAVDTQGILRGWHLAQRCSVALIVRMHVP